MNNVAIQDVLNQLPADELAASLNAFIEPLIKGIPDDRLRRNVPPAILGILGSGSPVVSAMAQATAPEGGSVWAQSKRFYRLLDSDQFDHETFFAGLYAIGQRILEDEAPRRVVIAIDPVNFEKPYTQKLEGISTVLKSTPPDRNGDARLTPGYPAITATVVSTRVPVVTYADWFSYTTDDFFGEKEQILSAFLASQRALLTYKRRYVADSGLDDDGIFGWMVWLGEEIVVRVKHPERIVEVPKAGEDVWTPTSVEAVSRSVRFEASFRVAFSHAGKTRITTIELGWAPVRLRDTHQRLWLVVAREVNDKGHEIGRILLLTNVPIGSITDAQGVYEDWRLRSRIEHVYRVDQEQGVDVEDIRVQTLERMRRLFALVIVAVAFAFHLGERWPPKAVLWLRQLGGKLGRASDRDGVYVLLRGLAALIQTLATLAFLAQHPFPHDAFPSTGRTLVRSPTYG